MPAMPFVHLLCRTWFTLSTYCVMKLWFLDRRTCKYVKVFPFLVTCELWNGWDSQKTICKASKESYFSFIEKSYVLELEEIIIVKATYALEKRKLIYLWAWILAKPHFLHPNILQIRFREPSPVLAWRAELPSHLPFLICSVLPPPLCHSISLSSSAYKAAIFADPALPPLVSLLAFSVISWQFLLLVFSKSYHCLQILHPICFFVVLFSSLTFNYWPQL